MAYHILRSSFSVIIQGVLENTHYKLFKKVAEINFTDELKTKLAEHHKACTVPSRDKEFLESLVTGHFLDDQQFKEYLFCISKLTGFQNENGDINKTLVLEELRKSIKDPSKAEEYTETCLSKATNSPTETVYAVKKCIDAISSESSVVDLEGQKEFQNAFDRDHPAKWNGTSVFISNVFGNKMGTVLASSLRIRLYVLIYKKTAIENTAVMSTDRGCLFVTTHAEINLTDEQKTKLVEHHKACTVPSRDKEFLESLVTGDLLDDQQFKEYLFCISKLIGFQNENGDINRTRILEKLRKSIKDPSKAEEYTETCLSKATNSPTETVYAVIKCVDAISPESSVFR
ncbi:hypothetical protein NQ317_010899 [Molorchus minor]|uniref:Uncharacterized protein n=1 Tax=Molorchus minor TaxID=1323400 RepID=A0ABQ9JQ35_9CUCU|nr:hypothetical protein NQ317_010899 [Molorchus minor]